MALPTSPSIRDHVPVAQRGELRAEQLLVRGPHVTDNVLLLEVHSFSEAALA